MWQRRRLREGVHRQIDYEGRSTAIASDSGALLLVWYFLGMTAAASALALLIWITYGPSDRIARLMGAAGSRTVTRLATSCCFVSACGF
jgi:hypothetical protein